MTYKKTMFGKPKNKRLADAISLVNPTQARKSTRKLSRLFKQARTRKAKVKVLRATVLAGNRALASINRRGLSASERRQYREIAGIYGVQSKKLSKQLRR